MHNSGPLWTTSGEVLSFTIHPPSLPRRRATSPHLATWVFVVPQVAGAGCCGGSGGVTGMTEISDLHSCNYTAVENSVDTVDSRAGGPVSGGSVPGLCAGSGLVRAGEGPGISDSGRGRLGSRPFRWMHRLFVSRRSRRSILTWENADRSPRDDTKSRVLLSPGPFSPGPFSLGAVWTGLCRGTVPGSVRGHNAGPGIGSRSRAGTHAHFV